MMWKNKSIFILFLMLAEMSFAQLNTYDYSREIKNISTTWHSITLPDEVFGKVSNIPYEFRIYGITENDTIEVPYILNIASGKKTDETIDFNLLNSSKKGDTYFYTFEISSEKTINEIQLNFKQENFNWLINLEGSQDNSEWFSIVEDYRILSIINDQTNYKFTDVKFPKSKYKYLRVAIKSDKKPELITAETQLSSFEPPTFKTYKVKNFTTKEDKNSKKTIVDIDLSLTTPINLVSLKIKDSVDYYRPVTIKYLIDSLKTEKGWKYNYNTLTSGVLSSLENNDIHFYGINVKKLRIEIENHDNRPLKIEGAIVKGFKYELVARFTEDATYYLAYGNPNVYEPNYDISKFTENIPSKITEVTLLEEKVINKKEVTKLAPLFENKLWLWIIMGVIIALLGWFTLKMISKK